MTTSIPEAAVDSVVRSAPAPSEVATTGWNPYDVWRTRVLLPRLVEKAASTTTPRSTAQSPALEVSAPNEGRRVVARATQPPALADEPRDLSSQKRSELIPGQAGSHAAVDAVLFDLLDALRVYAARKTVALLIERGDEHRR